MQEPTLTEKELEQITADIKFVNIRKYICRTAFALICVYLALFFVLPSYYLSITGNRYCPNNYLNFSDFCHTVNNPQSEWQSNIYGITPANKMLMIGASVTRNNSVMLYKNVYSLNYTLKLTPVSNEGVLYNPNYKQNPSDSEITTSVRIKCQKNTPFCSDSMLAIEPDIRYSDYQMWVSFNVGQNIFLQYQDVFFFVLVSNPTFSTFVEISKVFLFIFSVCAFVILFKHSQKHLLTYEHKYVNMLSFLLIIFNLPFVGLFRFRCALLILAIFVFYNMMFKKLSTKIQTEPSICCKLIKIVFTLVVFITIMMLSKIPYLEKRLDLNHGDWRMSEHLLRMKHTIIVVGVVLFSVFNLLMVIRSVLIFLNWASLSQRHQFFVFWNLFLLLCVYSVGVAFLYQPLSNEGINYFMFILLANLFVISHQVIYRFTDNPLLKTTTEDIAKNNAQLANFINFETSNFSEVETNNKSEEGKQEATAELNQTENQILVDQTVSEIVQEDDGKEVESIKE